MTYDEQNERFSQFVAGVAMDRVRATGRPFAVDRGPNEFGWSTRDAARPAWDGWKRLVVVEPGEDEVGAMKRLRTALLQGQKIPKTVLEWATGRGSPPERAGGEPGPLLTRLDGPDDPEDDELETTRQGPSQGLLF